MQAQVIQQRKPSIPWLPALIAALVVGGIVLTAQLAIDRTGTTAPAITVVPGTATTVDREADAQKAGMVEAGYTNVSGIQASTVGATKTSGLHPRTKFGGPVGGDSVDGRDAALRALITRIQLQRKANTLP
jgi:hypothetical protein